MPDGFAAGDADDTSDLDIGVFFEGEAVALPSLDWPCAHDLWLVDRINREAWSEQGGWQASAFLPVAMLFDRDGRSEDVVQRIIAAKDPSHDARFFQWDMYLNALYRSLKYRRKGVEYGFRACAAESALAYAEALFLQNGLVTPLPGRERASMRRLHDKVMQSDDEQMALLLKIVRDGDPSAQAALFSAVEPYLEARALRGVIDGWQGLLHLEIERLAQSPCFDH